MKRKSLIPILLFILVIVILLIIIFTLILGKTNETYKKEHFESLGYLNDKGFYYKNMTNNTMDDFYNLAALKKEAKFLEYKYEVNTNTFYETLLNNTSNITSSYVFSYLLNDRYIYIKYEIISDNTAIIINGTYDEENNDLTCNIENTYNYSSNLSLNDYCNNISNNIGDFINEKNNFISDSEFISILNDDSSKIVIGERQ